MLVGLRGMLVLDREPPVGRRPDAGRHVLCINDSPEILSLLREVLEEEGYRVTTRTHVDEDLAEMRGLAPDLILLDYLWSPHGEGWGLLEALRGDARLGAVPVVLVTGAVTQVQAHEEALHRLGVPVLYKPFDLDALVRVVRDALDGRPNLQRVGS